MATKYEVVKAPVAFTEKEGKRAKWHGNAGAVIELDDEQAAELGDSVRRLGEPEAETSSSSRRRSASRQRGDSAAETVSDEAGQSGVDSA